MKKENFLDYLKLGWSVVPIHHKTKIPCVKWKKYQTELPDEKTIDLWYKKFPQASIGVITGKLSGLWALDFEYQASLDFWKSTVCDLPDTLISKSNSNKDGCHYIFKRPPIKEYTKKKIKLVAGAGIETDFLADHAIAVLPPSVHTGGSQYQWVHIDPIRDGLNDLLPFPKEALDFVKSQNGKGRIYSSPAASAQSINQKNINTDQDTLSILENGVKQGSRNDSCTKICGYMLSKSGLDIDESETIDRCREWNKKNQPPLLDRDIITIVKSIAKTEARKRQVLNIPVARVSSPSAAVITRQDVRDALDRNEVGDARLFVQLHRNKFVFDHSLKCWHVWGNHYWEEDSLNIVLPATEAVTDLYVDEEKLSRKSGEKELANKFKTRINKMRTLVHKTRILKLASSGGRFGLGIKGNRWDQKAYLLPCMNGVVNLKTGVLSPGNPNDFLKTYCKTPFDPLAPQPVKFLSFLNDITGNDQSIIDYFHRLFGYSLIGQVIEHGFTIFFGQRGRNGKGVLLDILYQILSPLMSPVSSSLLMKQSHFQNPDSPSPTLLSLRGKRLVWASETEDNRSFNTGCIKLLTGGDPLTACAKFKNPVTWPPSHHLILLSNFKPEVNLLDNAFWSRVHLVNFPFSFVVNPDKSNKYEKQIIPRMQDEILLEASGILKWLVDGCLEYQKMGSLQPPLKVLEATLEYKNEEDIIGIFLSDRCEEKENSETSSNNLYEAYRFWCLEYFAEPVSLSKFGAEMSQRYPKKRRNAGNFYSGLILKSRKALAN